LVNQIGYSLAIHRILEVLGNRKRKLVLFSRSAIRVSGRERARPRISWRRAAQPNLDGDGHRSRFADDSYDADITGLQSSRRKVRNSNGSTKPHQSGCCPSTESARNRPMAEAARAARRSTD
jgi:hypothetical protein